MWGNRKHIQQRILIWYFEDGVFVIKVCEGSQNRELALPGSGWKIGRCECQAH